MVHPDFGHSSQSSSVSSTVVKCKEDPVDESFHPSIPPHQSSQVQLLRQNHHSRSTTDLFHQHQQHQQLKSRPGSPSIPPPSYSAPPHHPSYYPSHPSPYPAATAATTSDIMTATAQIQQQQRLYPPVYHNPSQSTPPVSVADHSHQDRHGRSIYPPNSSQISPHMYGYHHPYSSLNPIHQPSPYTSHTPSQHHPLNSPPMLMPHPTTAASVQHRHPSPTHAAAPLTSSPSAATTTTATTQQPVPSHRTVDIPPTITTTAPSSSSSSSIAHQLPLPPLPPPPPPPSNPNGPHISPNDIFQPHIKPNSSSSAPGPIPATTPLVVRQDNNGVQWINFVYSRDRVKVDYTIRCDVESINVDSLSPQFKTDNCVYPRAYCSKNNYKGNRLVYETECNAVGWALADLNPQLRGKRGLIQRAVDSWRNSNQDPRLRSRRVRRLAKLNRRQTVSPAVSTSAALVSSPVQLASGAGGDAAAAGSEFSAASASASRPSATPLNIGPATQMHHHHAPERSTTTNHDEVGNVDYVTNTHRPSITSTHPPTTDVRTAQVFHGYPTFPPTQNASSRPSVPPLFRDGGISQLNRHQTVATFNGNNKPDQNNEYYGGGGRKRKLREDDDYEIDNDDDNETCNENDTEDRYPDKSELFGCLPEGRRRKFILVEDTQRKCRVRIRATLDQVNADEIPDSYRMSNSVYPRTYFPVQMKESPGRVVPERRFFKNEIDETAAASAGNNNDDGNEVATIGRTLVPAPSLEGETEIAVPKLSKSRRRKDILVNDLGHRMCWSQSRIFAGRMLFLQRSLDAYRNKMRSSMIAAGRDESSIPQHFETRIGKRRWLRQQQNRRASVGTLDAAETDMTTSKRSAEEVEP